MSWADILAKLAAKRDFSTAMGDADRLAKHRASGKLDARQRAEALFDAGTFVELGGLAANLSDASASPAPADGLITGFGMIDGRPALTGIEDFTVLAGSIGDAGATKRYRLTQLAAQERLPLVFMLEGAGHRLTNEHANPAPNDLQGLAALMGQVPMVCLVLGASAGHGALTAPLSDFVVMTPAAALFVAGPPIVKAAIGETVTKEELGGPRVHLASGVAHNLAADDGAAIALARRYLGYFAGTGVAEGPRRLEAILDLIPSDPRLPFAIGPVLELLCDTGSVLEIQPGYGGTLVTALARLGGQSVAIVANNPAVMAGAVDAAAAQKAARFIAMADAHALPLLFLTDNPGVQPGSASERAGMLRHAARMFAAQHRARVPKLHVTLRKAFGFGSSIMAMNPFDGQTLSLAFPAISLGAMPAAAGAQAAGLSGEDQEKALAAQTGSAWALSSKMAYDDIIDPRDLRNALLTGLAMTANRRRETHKPEGLLP
jgi:methylmalonyl-CoA decarboxylase subunit alpha